MYLQKIKIKNNRVLFRRRKKKSVISRIKE